jgi:hypothetical protein
MFCKAPVHLRFYRDVLSTRKYKQILKLNFEKKSRIEEANLIKQQDKKDAVRSFMLESVRCNKCNDKLTIKNDATHSLSSAAMQKVLQCVSCETVFCDLCFLPLGSDTDTHVCVSKIKPCPRCCNLIEKEEAGCDQMFCVLCNVVFSWKTGLIVDTDAAHNPHYYQWKRKTGNLSRNELDDPREGRFYIKCETDFKDQKIKLSEIHSMFGLPSVFEVDKTDFLLSFHRMFLDMLLEVSKILDRETDIRYNLRVSYISNTISMTSWKRNLKKHFYIIKQYEAIKYNTLKTLDRLYTLVLDDNFNDAEIEKMCIQAVQQNDNLLMY